MNITVSTEKLQTILDSTTRIATKHITLPILQCVSLEAVDGFLTITTTNLEIGIKGTIPGTVDEVGKVFVPAQTFRETIALITQKEVTLSTEGELLHIEAESSKTDIKTMDGNDFPTIPGVSGTTYSIQSSLFAYGIKTTAFAASQSSIKPELGSIYIFQKKEHSLTFVTTDSFRLIEKTVPQKNLVFEGSVLIPFKNALELSRVADETDCEIQMCIGENQCSLTTPTLYITSRLVSGTFPDYEQIIPKEYKTEAIVLVKDLSASLKKTNIFLNKFMQLTCTVGQNTFTVSSQNTEAGATTESIKATTKGEDIRLNFNQRYVSDIIPHLSDDSVLIKCAGIGRPMVIQNAHEQSLRYLVMPMNK